MDKVKETAVIQEARICLLAGARVANSADPSDAVLVLLSAPLSELHGSIFEAGRLAELVEQQFGWQIPPETIDFFVPKMRGLGWLDSRSDFPSQGPFYVNLPEPTVDDDAVDTKAALAEMGKHFQQFAKDLSPLTILPSDPSEAGAILLRYVVDANLPFADANAKVRTDEEFIAARYVEHVNKNKLPAKETMASLSAVGYLFRVAEEIGHPSNKRKADLKLIIDGPILLDYLGCSGPIRSDASRDMFSRLRKLDVSTVTFRHCVNEARDALRSVLKTNPRDRYGPTGEALRKGWVNENALLNLSQAFDVAVRNNGIEILPDDIEFMPNTHRFFDTEETKAIEEIVNWHDGENENARYADSDTTVLTIRRRAGYRTSDIFTSKYVCVTSNEAFSGAIRRHLINTNYYNSRQISAVVSLKELSAKLWLEIGEADREARLSLPNSQLLLSCDRALRFNRKVVEKAREELKKVNPGQLQQFELLLEVPRSARAVMDFTLNNEKYVTGGNVDKLVEAAIEAAGAEVGARAREQRIKDREKFRKDLAAAELAIEKEKRIAEQHRQAAYAAEAEKLAFELRAQEADLSMLEALSARASERFGVSRTWIRSASIFAAFAPLVIAVWSVLDDRSNTFSLIFAALVAGLAAATAMDRPGAWLSKIIQHRIDIWAERKLRDLGRDDLASEATLVWTNGVAVATRAEDH